MTKTTDLKASSGRISIREGCRADAFIRRYVKAEYRVPPRNCTLPLEDLQEVEVDTTVLRRCHRRRSDRFLKGPIPIHLVVSAANLPGKALAVMLAIHHQVTLTGKTSVSLPAGLLTELGINRDAKARALRQLELAGLIRVERASGRAARISLS